MSELCLYVNSHHVTSLPRYSSNNSINSISSRSVTKELEMDMNQNIEIPRIRTLKPLRSNSCNAFNENLLINKKKKTGKITGEYFKLSKDNNSSPDKILIKNSMSKSISDLFFAFKNSVENVSGNGTATGENSPNDSFGKKKENFE